MKELSLHELHERLKGRFLSVNGAEAVAGYGDSAAEWRCLRESAGVLDLSFRSRLCLTGSDRARFLHGQVTNDIKGLKPGAGCYAALVTAKGKLESDLNVYRLAEELLLDFEPGFATAVTQRLERYIVADDVQVVDAGPAYGLLSVQGPAAAQVVMATGVFTEGPGKPFAFVCRQAAELGEWYLMDQPRLGTSGFDLFVPATALESTMQQLVAAAARAGGGACGWRALESARIEAGIPRFGVDMDERNFPQECGIEARGVSYSKGCYIGQEVLNRIHTMGHVNVALRGLRMPAGLAALPARGEQLFHGGKEAGYLTSATVSFSGEATLGLGLVRRPANAPGTELRLRTGAGEVPARVVELPFG